ncbi:MAG: c-type cytochrome [Rubricella sp.]
MDALEFNKIAAGVIAALLSLQLFSWGSEIVYGLYGDHGHEEQAFVIDVPDAEPAEAVEEEETPVGELLAMASASDGESLWRACAACHVLEQGVNGVGPYLYGVVGRDIAAVDGFNYSSILTQYGEEGRAWNPEDLYAFLENPRGYAPGTTMGYSGMRRSEDRVNLIAYLASVSDTDLTPFIEAAATEEAPMEEPAVEEAAADEAPAEDAATEEAAADAMMQDAVEEAEAAAAEVETAAEETVAEAEAVVEETTAAADEAVEEAAETVATTADESEAAAEDMAADVANAAEETAAEATDAVEEAAAEATEAVEEATRAAALPAFMASADAAAGQAVFRQCQACHVVDQEQNRVGPHLVGLIGRDIASIEGFRYSNALLDLEGAWTYEELNAYLENPRGYAPGTRMSFNGLRDEQDRANVIAYIEQAGGN